jgi:hypothetical protein
VLMAAVIRVRFGFVAAGRSRADLLVTTCCVYGIPEAFNVTWRLRSVTKL